MTTQKRNLCCGRLAATLSGDAARRDGAALIVREGPDGALYFKITSGDHEFSDSNVNEPLAFCPFCGASLTETEAYADTRLDLSFDDEELTLVAA